MLKIQTTAATHSLESQRQALLAGLNHSKPQQLLTPWQAKEMHCQHALNTATVATHNLEFQEQSLSACLKHSKT